MSTFSMKELIGLVLLTWLAQRLVAFYQLRKTWSTQPMMSVIFRPFWIFAAVLPSWRPLTFNELNQWRSRWSWFEGTKATVYGVCSLFPPAYTVIVGDPEAVNFLFSNEGGLTREVDWESKLSGFFGDHLLTVEGDDWKRHRKIVAEPFSKRSSAFVWEQTQSVITDMIEDLDSTADAQGQVLIGDVGELTRTLALVIISRAGFHQDANWGLQRASVSAGHSMRFVEAVAGVLDGAFHKAVLPNWAMQMTAHTRHLAQAYRELELYLREMIDERRKLMSEGEEFNDLFSRLLAANDSEQDPKRSLSTQEIFGEMFLLLLAGHETSAHAVSEALILLALHPEKQAKAYEEVSRVLSDSISDYAQVIDQLVYIQAIFAEVIRMYVPAINHRRRATRDVTVPYTVLPVKAGEKAVKSSFHIPAGSRVYLNGAGKHYSPLYWDEPEVFRPERFVPDSEGDVKIIKGAYSPFGGSGRICPGRFFAQAEVTCIVAYIVKHYRLKVTPDVAKLYERRDNESQTVRLERVMKTRPLITITHGKVPLIFERRE